MRCITVILSFVFCVFLTFSTEAAQKQRVPQAIFPKESISFYEERCYHEINRVRQEHGLRPLIWWSPLSDCARKHCQNMADRKCEVGHDGFNERFESMQKIGRVTFFGENVAYCYNYENPVNVSVEGWMDSDGHRKNILEADFEETGIGVAISKKGEFYITQLFAKRINPKGVSDKRAKPKR